jgi:hypothetical protein
VDAPVQDTVNGAVPAAQMDGTGPGARSNGAGPTQRTGDDASVAGEGAGHAR